MFLLKFIKKIYDNLSAIDPAVRLDAMKTEETLTPQGALAEGGMHDLLGYQLAQATIVTNEGFTRAVGEPLGLRKVEFTILQLVRANAPVTAARVAKSLAVTTPSVKVWLDQLEQRGLIARERGPVDRRTHDLRITRKGETLVSKALAALHATDREILTDLTEAERLMLLQLLQKVAHSRKG